MPSPTLEHLSVQWLVEGDTDNDATVAVRWRVSGGAWQEGTPLRRTPAGEVEGFAWANKHAGTVFDLSPGTDYEVELYLSDPDGGCEVRVLEASTRPVPAPTPGATVIPVDPGSFEDAAAAAVAGDVLELSAGTYASFTFPNDGTEGAPIVIRAAGDGVVIDGEVRLDGRSYVIVQGLEVHGQIKFNDATELAIIGNHVLATEDGIVTKTRAENLYIADNLVEGATVWAEGSLGVDGDNIGEGIEVTGPGHVIEHNRVTGFRDGISFLEDDGAVDQYSIDVLYNDISEAADDGIEADFCFHDCRIVGNRLTNVFMGVSSQPGLGGPTYFVRNAIYNAAFQAFKLQRGSVGDVAWHNTVVKMGDALSTYTEDAFSRQHFRNNLFLGGPGAAYNGYDNGEGDVIDLSAATDVDLDYDGFGSTAGMFTGNLGGVAFASLAELQAMTSEVHAVEVDPSVFAAAVEVPASAFPGLAPADLRSAGGTVAEDAGEPIAGFGFAGAAPDLGAYEVGDALPEYGPRE
ncbi:MAG: right-handed parallel beta-helix repeat-containing protein [Myxococcales bacterium]|nr:right-handed parallel beta-helix repeat-containing protein [Myxococcales bacterium]